MEAQLTLLIELCFPFYFPAEELTSESSENKKKNSVIIRKRAWGVAKEGMGCGKGGHGAWQRRPWGVVKASEEAGSYFLSKIWGKFEWEWEGARRGLVLWFEW